MSTPPDEPPASLRRPGSRVVDRLDCAVRAVRRTVARHSPSVLRAGWLRVGQQINLWLPKGLLGRSMLIIVLPMLILLSVLTSVFLDRHWLSVTERLSAGVVRDIGALIAIAEAPLPDSVRLGMLDAAGDNMQMTVALGPSGDLGSSEPDLGDIVHRMLATAIRASVNRPYTITNIADNTIEIRLPIRDGTLIVSFPRRIAFAANWYFFLVWMVATAAVLIIISIVFLRNQIRPIQRLADAADAFGKGQIAPDFAPSGAREVRKAAYAFIGMRRRIERQIEQRTTMLAGVSHDLRTILTRFKLELALQPETEETAAMRSDVAEMEAMLSAYLDFARGDPDEVARPVDLTEMIGECVRGMAASGREITIDMRGDTVITVRATGFRRMLTNLIGNAARYGKSRISIVVERRDIWLTIIIDDDGPGVPEDQREAVFRPFYRLDQSRNQDISGTGLGLTIARDVARSHGGEISLGTNAWGGLRATARIPG